MSAKKNRSQMKSSGKATRDNTNRAKDPSSDSDEQKGRLEGHDENRTSRDATFEHDYDVDEDDFAKREDEYSDYNTRNAASDAENS